MDRQVGWSLLGNHTRAVAEYLNIEVRSLHQCMDGSFGICGYLLLFFLVFLYMWRYMQS